MSKISVSKIRGIDSFSARKDIIKCLSGEDFRREFKILCDQFPHEDYYDFLLETTDKTDEDFINTIDVMIKLEKTDLDKIISAYIERPLYAKISYIFRFLEELSKQRKNPTFKVAIKRLEDWIIERHEGFIKNGYGEFYVLFHMLETDTCSDHKKIIYELFKVLKASRSGLEKYMYSLPDRHPLRKYIKENLIIHDIIT
jgi:hypothetical protein